jgi:ATP-dependent Clp protease ATP-binding subunit ClpA
MSEAVERSIALADRLDHPEVGTSHLLLALIDDDDGVAYRLVASAGGTPLEIRSRVETSLPAA